MSRRSSRPISVTPLRLALSLAIHFGLLYTLPGDGADFEPVDVDVIPISAELLRSQAAQVGEPSEPPPSPAAPTEPPPTGAITQGPTPPPGPGPETPPPAPPPPTNAASPRTRGLAAKLPANVRFAVIVRPKMLEGSPHEERARETIRRAIGMRLDTSDPDGGVVDPLEGLEELVVVTQNPFERGNFAAAAAGRKGTAPPPGYDKKGRDLVRAADPARPSKLPRPPRFPWRQRLLAISDPLDGSPRPVVAMVGNDVDALTFGMRLPVPPRIDLAVFETEDHGSIAHANASFDSIEDATAATEAWKSALEARCSSALLALIGLGGVCRRIEIVQEGKVVHGTLTVDSAEVDKLLSLLQATMRGRRRP